MESNIRIYQSSIWLSQSFCSLHPVPSNSSGWLSGLSITSQASQGTRSPARLSFLVESALVPNDEIWIRGPKNIILHPFSCILSCKTILSLGIWGPGLLALTSFTWMTSFTRFGSLILSLGWMYKHVSLYKSLFLDTGDNFPCGWIFFEQVQITVTVTWSSKTPLLCHQNTEICPKDSLCP